MQISTDGMVIREQNIRDEDRLLTLLTRDRGVLKAYAKGAKRPKSPLAGSTELFSYSRFVLFEHRGRISVDRADAERIFFHLRGDMESLSLATYLAQLAAELLPEGEGDAASLRLLLNCLHMLDAKERSPEFIKPLYELRLLSLAGFMPDLVACKVCAAYESDPMYFLPRSGALRCKDCLGPDAAGALPLSPAVLAAMRYILYSDFEKLFSFQLPPEGLAALGRTSQTYLLTQLERSFSALAFYESLRAPNP